MQTVMSKPMPRRPWVVPVLVATTAAPTFVAFWIGGQPGLGAAWAGVSLVLALVLALGGRSETIQMLRGDEDDERALVLENQAMNITALTLTTALVALFFVAGVRGESGLVYGVLLLLGEGTHLVALAVLNRRS